MSKSRYIMGLAVGVAIFIIGIVLSNAFAVEDTAGGFIFLSYIGSCTVVCLIWLDPVVGRVSLSILATCQMIAEFISAIFNGSGDSFSCGAVFAMIILIPALMVLFVLFFIMIFTYPAIATVLFPFRAYYNAKDLY